MEIPDYNQLTPNTVTERYIKTHYSEFYKYLIDNYPEDLKFTERIYWYFHNISSYPLCEICNEKRVGFEGFRKGYRRFCCQKCLNGSDYKKEKVKKTNLEKYGCMAPAQSAEIQEQIKQRHLAKYGVSHPKKFKGDIHAIKETELRIPDPEKLNAMTITERSMKIHYPVFHELLINSYPQDLKFTERIYWYFHNITSYPLCEHCKKKRTKFDGFWRGYKHYCSLKCMNQDDDKKEKTKQTNLKRYGYTSPNKNSKIKEKTKQHNIKKYGVDNPMKLPEIYQKSINTCIERYGGCGNASEQLKKKFYKTCDKLYGENPSNTKEFRQRVKITCLKRYGVDSFSKTDKFKNTIHDKQPEIRIKVHNTKKQHGTFNSSSIEQKLKNYLEQHGVNFEYQYRSEKYPFNCDFYFPDTDTYLEIQGSWLHGGHPYDSYSEQDIETLNKWKSKSTKFYNVAIETWTVRDVVKRNHAKENNLKWIEIFSMKLDEIISILKENNTI